MAFESGPINNQQQDNKDQQQQQQTLTTGAGSSGAFAGGGGAAPQQSKPGSPKGSGRYTNIKKYIEANQGAGERLAGGIQGSFQRQINPYEQTASKAQGDVQSGLQQGQQELQRGQQTLQKLQGPGFDASAIAGDEAALTDFAKFKAGQNINEQTLFEKNRQLQDTASQIGGKLGQQQQNVATEEGRFGLLGSTFGGGGRKQYGTGQQRLDQLFLQAGGGNQIGALRQNLSEQQKQNLAREQTAKSLGMDISGLQAQESELGSALGKSAQSLEQGFIDQLQGRVGEVQAGREKEQKELRTALDFITGKTQDAGGVDVQSYLSKLGITPGTQTFGFFNEGFNPEDYIKLSQNKATSYKDIAGAEDVNKYSALAKLAYGGVDQSGKFIGPQEAQLKLTQAGNLDPAAQILQGQSGRTKLQEGLDTAAQKFLERAMGTNVGGYGKDTYTNMWGQGGTTEATAQANLGQLLTNAGFNPSMFTSTPAGLGQTAGAIGDLTRSAGVAGIGGGLAAGGLGFGNVFATAGKALDNIGNIIGGDQQGGAQSAAQRNANADLQKNIAETLKKMGYGQVINAQGKLVDAFDQQRELDQAKLAQKKFAESQKDSVGKMLEGMAYVPGSGNIFKGGSIGGTDQSKLKAISTLYDKYSKSDLYGKKSNKLDEASILKSLGYDPAKAYETVSNKFGATRQLSGAIADEVAKVREFANNFERLDQEKQRLANETRMKQTALNNLLGRGYQLNVKPTGTKK